MAIYYVDGEFVSDDKAVVSVKDIAVLRGFGAFDFLRTYNRRPFYLKEHIDRMQNSAKLIMLPLGYSTEEIMKICQETLDRNPEYHEANIRIVITGGPSSDGVCPEGKGKLIVMVTEKHELPDWWYSKGGKVITVDTERYIPGAKSTSYMGAAIAQMQAKEEDAIEALYVDRNGRLLEGTTTNIFCVKNGKISTTGTDILPGITRGVLLNILKGKFDIEIRDIMKSEIADFDEIFITASNKEIVPVVDINGMKIGNGQPGKVTKQVMEIFAKYTDEYGKGLK